MTPKQITFCQNYLSNGFNGKKAAEDAGYTGNVTAYAHKLLQKDQIRDFLAKKAEVASEKADLSIEKVLSDLELAKEIALGKKDEDTGEYLKADLNPYLKATEMQGKYLKMFTDKVEVSIDSHTELMKLIKERANGHS